MLRNFKSSCFCLGLCPSAERASNLLHVTSVVQIVRHYDPLTLQVETINWFGFKDQSLHPYPLVRCNWDFSLTSELNKL